MSEMVVNEIGKFNNFKYEPRTKQIVNLKGATNADLDEFLAIAHIL
ncbi:MAG: hypothetical protein GY932_12650, partial [Arcobacter sp.]|nr:hypothetical protein [Arcobacter sp.]